tara:strand:- start:866 stop:3448 length:2583 start_codon:yes stop_codon:yes gene_type:complete
MTVRSLNGLNGTSTGVVITNRMEAQLPLEQTQATFLDPITIAMKGLNGFGGAGKVIKVNSSNNALEYATDEGSNWTLNGSSLYPLATSTNVLIGSTTNTNNKKFFVNGTSEFNNDVVINNGSAESRLLIGTNSFTENGSLVVYNPTGAGLVIFSPTQGQGNRISLRGVSNTGSDEARITFDPETGLLNETYLRFQYADKYFFDKQIIIDTTGAELSNGTNTYTLPSSTGTLALTSDISTGYWELPVVGSNALVPTDDDYFIQLQKQTDSTFETLLEFYNINQYTDYQYFRFSMNDPGTNARLKFDSERNSTITNVYEIYDSGYMAFNKGIEIKDTSFQFTAPNGNNFSFPTSGGSGILATTNTIPTNNNELTNGRGFITASSTDTLTNKSISYSQITGTPTVITNNNQLVNGRGFITASSSDILTNKLISYSQITGTPTTITNNNQLVNGAGYITNSGNESISVNNIIGANDSGNNIGSSTSYGWEFRGADNRQISFPGYTYYAFLGASSTYSYIIHINSIGDAYRITGTNTSNLKHSILGNVDIISNGDLSMPNGDLNITGDITGTNCDITIDGDLTVGADIRLTTPATGDQDDMPRLMFNTENDNCFMTEQFYSNGPSGDMVWKLGGGDVRMFKDNTINSNATNYQALFFLYGSANDNRFYIYAGGSGGSSSNIFLDGSTFDGNRSYSGGSSDDRLKFEEELITNATDTLMKLRPQIYMKDDKLPQRRNRKDPNIIEDNEDIIRQKEAGLIAQEVYYECPELRHLVLTRVENEEDIQELPDGTNLNDIQNDPDYVSLGWDQYTPANVKYIELIPYLIKSNQEQQEEINTLKTELDTYKSIIDTLINSKSFADFKKNIA